MVVGLGRAGFAAARAIAAQGVEVRLGRDGVDMLRDVRAVVKSPGVTREATDTRGRILRLDDRRTALELA